MVANPTLALPPAVNVDSATDTVANSGLAERRVSSVELAR
jgi:hypothetical protein